MRYFALGDSLTRGSGAGPAGSWANQLAALWRAQGRLVEFHNLAVSGYTVDQLLANEVAQLPQARPDDVVSVAIGTNDVTHLAPVEHYQDQVRRLTTALSQRGYNGPQVFSVPQPDWSQTYDGRSRGSARILALIEAYNDALQYETIAYGGQYVDLWPLMRQQAAAGMWSSGVHPSATAYTQWAQALASELAGWLPSVSPEAPAPSPAPTLTGGGASSVWRWYGFLAERLGLVAHPRGTGFPLAEPLTPARVFAAHPDVSTLVCGPMFDGSDARPILGYRYVDTAAGLDVQGSEAHAATGWTLNVDHGAPVVRRHREVIPGASVAIQCPFAMVENGRNAWNDANERNVTWRCAVGVLSDKRLLFGIGNSGLPELTRAALRADYGGASLRWLFYLDGGHVAELAQRDWRWGARPAPAPGFLVERNGTPTRTPPATSSTTQDAGPGGGGGGRSRPAPRAVARAMVADGWGAYLAGAVVGAVAGSAPLWLPSLMGRRAHKR